VVDTAIGVSVSAGVDTGITVDTPGIGLGLSITLAVDVVDTAIRVSISTGVDTGIAVNAPGIGFGLSITLAIDVVDTAIGVSISTGVDTGIAVHTPGIGLGLSITLAIDMVDTAIGISISTCVDTRIAVDTPGSWLSLSLALAIQVGSGVDWVDGLDNMSSVGQVLDGLLVGSQFRGSLLLGLGEVRGDCARSWVEFQTGVDRADNWGNTNNTTDSWVTSIEQSGVSGRGGAGASKSHNCDKSLHFGYCLVMLPS